MKNIRYIIAVFIVYVTQFALAEVQALSDYDKRICFKCKFDACFS